MGWWSGVGWDVMGWGGMVWYGMVWYGTCAKLVLVLINADAQQAETQSVAHESTEACPRLTIPLVAAVEAETVVSILMRNPNGPRVSVV